MLTNYSGVMLLLHSSVMIIRYDRGCLNRTWASNNLIWEYIAKWFMLNQTIAILWQYLR